MDMQPGMMDDVTSDDKLWAALSWFFAPLVPIIVILLEDKKNRPFIKYNAIQALILTVVGYAISSVLSAVLIGCFTGIALFFYVIYLTLQAYNGKWVTIPVVTDFAKKQGWI